MGAYIKNLGIDMQGAFFIGLSTKVDKIICPLTLKKQKHCAEKALKVLFCHFGAVKW